VEADPVREYGDDLVVVTVTRSGLPDPAPALESLAAATSATTTRTVLPSGGPLPGLLTAARGHLPVHVPGAGVTGWLSTAAGLLRRAAWDSVDGFDPRFLAGAGGVGDLDLADRLARAGWLVVHEPGAGADLVATAAAGAGATGDDEGDEPARTGHGILDPHTAGLRRYVHDRSRAPARVLLALALALRRGQAERDRS
jgi:N-acetylglucosaminyl-diphospho-decaprenol L-rhamnosyltransferase